MTGFRLGGRRAEAPSPLCRGDAAALLQEYRRTRDPVLFDQLVSAYTALIRKLAHRFSPGSGCSTEDLVQVGRLGLLAAIDRYDPELGVAFTTFAVPTIRGEIMRWLRDYTWEVKPPRLLRERSLRVQRLRQQLWAELGQAPTLAQLSDAAALPIEEIERSLDVALLRRGCAMEDLAGLEGAGPAATPQNGLLDRRFLELENRTTLYAALRHLPPREHFILRARFLEDATQSEVAGMLGVSQFHVSRLERRALAKMRILLGDSAPSGSPEASAFKP